jgi:signal transduction histidine kinase
MIFEEIFMNEDELIIICGVIFVIFTIIFLIVLNKKQKNSIKNLEDKIISLQEKNFDQEVNANKNNAVTVGNFTIEQIKKIESLEDEVRKQKKRVKDAKAMVEEAYQVKSKFLSNMKAEIRTPINSIVLSSEFLVNNIQEKKLNNYAKDIVKSGKKLLGLIDEILELSSIESGSFTFEENPVDIKNLLHSIVNSHTKEAMKKGLELSLDIDDKLPDYLMLDISRVEDIVKNLVENALKFTHKGYVRIKLQESGKNILKNSINISLVVADSGVGIKEEEQHKIFEIFETTAHMGLSINKKIAKLMHGDIVVESTSKGSIFTFSMSDVEVVLPSAETQKNYFRNDRFFID